MEPFMKEFQHLEIQLEDIKSATDDFNDNKIIGHGGFGKVYKGEISHSKGRSTVAFKRLDRKYGQGDPEFWKEIMMLSRYTHKNLISLLGFCNKDGEKILVYEYASNGSLDRHLSDLALTWTLRIKICLDAARGLSYLHDDKGTQQRVLHRDIKSSNILLDENWNAKVSDMGLSKIGPANQQHTALVTTVIGTFGYLDPMYMEFCFLTKESDVYSFGVVLFEVLCGKLCFEHSNGRFPSLVRMWKQSYKKKKLDEIIFQELVQRMDPKSLETFSDIAYQCLNKSREERPTMPLVVKKLEIALQFQERHDLKLTREFNEKRKAAVPPLKYKSVNDLNVILSKGVLNGGKTQREEVNQLLDKPQADKNSSISSQVKSKKRKHYNIQSKSDSVQHVLEYEIAKFTDHKGGLVDFEGVKKLIQLMQTEKIADLTCRIMLAGVISVTDRLDCLTQFVERRGLQVLDEWLQEVIKGKNIDKSVEEFVFVLIRALDILPVNLHAIQMCNIGKSVNQICRLTNPEIKKKARGLIDKWKRRVEAEMNISYVV